MFMKIQQSRRLYNVYQLLWISGEHVCHLIYF